MKNFIIAYWKTLLFFAIIGLIGGFFVGIYQLDSFPTELRQQVYDQGVTNTMLGLVSAVQSAGLGIVLGALGILLGKQTGLWKDEQSLTKKPLIISLVIGIVGGMVLILSDLLFFGNYSQVIIESYSAKPTIPYLIAMVIYGGIIEEVMLRLFFMSLIAFILHKMFGNKNDKPTTTIFIVSNFIAAILFAAGHLPINSILFGLTTMIVFRCFLLNGGLALLFGYLYQKYGLRYAMIAHAGCHVVSKLIWILFI